MPKRDDIDSVMIIGAGPIIIGQACEFDYSGTQACKALKEEGYRVILVNSNPATIMTDPNTADSTYIEPITPDIVASILEKELRLNPHKKIALLPTMGGQTALNTALALDADGTLERLGVEMVGAKADVIDKAEDRDRFKQAMQKIGLECAKAEQVYSYEQALKTLEMVGLPAIIRPSFTMGGTGGGIAYNMDEFKELVEKGLRLSPVHSVLVEESVLGWKEYEMEVVRDCADNCIIVCSIENIDPMGVHTGDSITVAPALTLTDKEYQIMRDASLKVLREIGVDTGGSNVQFAVNPDDGRMIVIEMNPRVSRSSALASKATGFPIAKVAAKLAMGYRLDELDNDITKTTPSSFEPTIDYVVTKIPRFAFEKFQGAAPDLTTAMKSVGEAMAVGRSFCESFQKALRSLETGLMGFQPMHFADDISNGEFLSHVSRPRPERILYVGDALRRGISVDDIYAASKIDKWFLRQFAAIIEAEKNIIANGLPTNRGDFMRLKRMGFSDAQLSLLTNIDEDDIRAARLRLDIMPVYKRIDTCAAEFPSFTSYMYSSYEGNEFYNSICEAAPSNRTKIAILGGGPNRIGQGIEFDYCCVHAAYALADAGYETIMINCNPETVSTDYDTSDRLYFEPLCEEDVLNILMNEQKNGTLKGVIVQLGGQTPLKLASALEKNNVPILGTSPDAIDLAEDRERFQKLLHELKLLQPSNGIAFNRDEAIAHATAIGFPVVIRPSYVLGGRAMEIVHSMEQLDHYIENAVQVSGKNPVLIDQYLRNAIEVDVDAIADGQDVYIAGIMEHIEEAGIHSGDSACSLPAYSLDADIQARLIQQTQDLARALSVVGLMNVQFAVKGDDIYILEVNPRASRTVPFVAKATGVAVAKIAARIMAGETLKEMGIVKKTHPPLPHMAVKEAVFPFNRFPGVDVMLGPEMRSTGEVMGIDNNFIAAFAKAQIAANAKLRPKNKKLSDMTAFISVKDDDKPLILQTMRLLFENDVNIVATKGTAEFLNNNHIPATAINKVTEGQPHIVDAMINGDIDIVFNTTEGKQALIDSKSLRQTALLRDIPYYTTAAGIKSAGQALIFLAKEKLQVKNIQNYFQ